MQAALCELVIDGVPNNIDEQLSVLGDPRFRRGDYDTDFFREDA
jgi:acetyl-CoA carboxylase biotin carboxylase subunit